MRGETRHHYSDKQQQRRERAKRKTIGIIGLLPVTMLPKEFEFALVRGKEKVIRRKRAREWSNDDPTGQTAPSAPAIPADQETGLRR